MMVRTAGLKKCYGCGRVYPVYALTFYIPGGFVCEWCESEGHSALDRHPDYRGEAHV